MRKIEDNLEKDKTQLIITTHNNFIANKLDLSNLILLNNNNGIVETRKINNKDDKELCGFFTKIRKAAPTEQPFIIIEV